MGQMTDGLFDGEVTARGVMPTLRCANPDCNNAVGQVHFYGSGGIFRILDCAKCHRGSEYRNTPDGIAVKLLAKKAEKTSRAAPTGVRLSAVDKG